MVAKLRLLMSAQASNSIFCRVVANYFRRCLDEHWKMVNPNVNEKLYRLFSIYSVRIWVRNIKYLSLKHKFQLDSKPNFLNLTLPPCFRDFLEYFWLNKLFDEYFVFAKRIRHTFSSFFVSLQNSIFLVKNCNCFYWKSLCYLNEKGLLLFTKRNSIVIL